MTDTRRKAQAMLNDARDAHVNPDDYLVGYTALCRAIEQHEAFKQDVSRVMAYFKALYPTLPTDYDRFIIPAPKPDPLVEAMADCGVDRFESWADQLRAALEARGFEIRSKNDD